jgi:hypothetical protein
MHSTGYLGRALSVPEASACGQKQAIGTTARFDRVSLEYPESNDRAIALEYC